MGTVSQAWERQGEGWGVKRQQDWSWTLDQMPRGRGMETGEQLELSQGLLQKAFSSVLLMEILPGHSSLDPPQCPSSRKTLFCFLCSTEKLAKLSAHSFSWILISFLIRRIRNYPFLREGKKWHMALRILVRGCENCANLALSHQKYLRTTDLVHSPPQLRQETSGLF